jgi:predicted secreted protein
VVDPSWQILDLGFAELLRNGGQAFRAGRLQCAPVEFTGVDNTDRRRIFHRFNRGYRS